MLIPMFASSTTANMLSPGTINGGQIKDDGGFHVYTLHVKTNNSFDVYIDAEMVSSGSLLEDMRPPLVPPQEIDDPEDEQPEEWVTQVRRECRWGGEGRQLMVGHGGGGGGGGGDCGGGRTARRAGRAEEKQEENRGRVGA